MTKRTTVGKAVEFGLWAVRSAVHGHELAAFVWGFAAAHYGGKALDEGARLTAAGWVSADLDDAGLDLVDHVDRWLDGGDLDPRPRGCDCGGDRLGELCPTCRVEFEAWLDSVPPAPEPEAAS